MKRNRTAAVLAALRAYAPDRKTASAALDRLRPLELAHQPQPADGLPPARRKRRPARRQRPTMDFVQRKPST